jgi:hypothetical protein
MVNRRTFAARIQLEKLISTIFLSTLQSKMPGSKKRLLLYF